MATSSNEFLQVISQELVCPVCLEELKDPKNLSCPHNVCRECLERMPKQSRKKIVCPLCKKHTAIPDGGVASLHTNVTLVRLVEATLRRKAKIEIQKSLERGKPEVNLLEKEISHFEKALSALILDQKRVENDIHENVNQLIDIIRKQEASLCEEVVEFYDRQKGMIEREKNDLHKRYSDASKSVQEAEAIIEKSSIDASEMRSVAETLAKKVETITQSMQEKSRPSIATLERLEFNVNADADNHNSIFQHGKFGKLTKGILNADSTSPVAASRSHYLSTSLTTHQAVSSSQESQKLSSERKEGTPQKLATPGLKDNTPHTSSLINGENICDFCRLPATLICKTCLKPVCNTCVYVYEQDLCPPTKKEHQFENIVAQSSNTNGTPSTDSDLPWACEHCTFFNSPSHSICAVCATSRGVKEAEGFPESGTRRCANRPNSLGRNVFPIHTSWE